MDKLIITGGSPLKGDVEISGAKNAALPVLISSLLAEQPVKISNVPHLNDITTTIALLKHLGVDIELDDNMTVNVDAKNVSTVCAPYELVKTMRASILVLGPPAQPFWQSRSLNARRLRYRIQAGESSSKGIRGNGSGSQC